jgi:hypothetical protein
MTCLVHSACFKLLKSSDYIMYHITLCTTLHYVPHYIMYHITLCTTLHYVPHYIMYHITLCTTLHYVPIYIVYHFTLCTTLHCVPHYIVYHILWHSKFYMVLTALMCCVRTSEQTATFTTYNINRLVLYNRVGVCLLRGTDCILTYNKRFLKGLKVVGEKFILTAVHSTKTRRSRLTGNLYSSDHCAAWCHAKRSQWRVKGVVR